VALIVLCLAGCSGTIDASADQNDGSFSVSQGGTYAYSFPDGDCVPIATVSSPYCALGLTNSSGQTTTLTAGPEYETTTGSVYLAAGNWTGAAGLVYGSSEQPANCTGSPAGSPIGIADGSWFCPLSGLWSLTLTPQ
jgi:hypothetical protein